MCGEYYYNDVINHTNSIFNMELFTPDFHSPINTNVVVVMIVGVQSGQSESRIGNLSVIGCSRVCLVSPQSVSKDHVGARTSSCAASVLSGAH